MTYLKSIFKKPDKLALGLLIALTMIALWRWFWFPLLTSGDWWFQFAHTAREWVDIPRVWEPGGLGSANLGLSNWPSLFLHGLFGLVGFDSNISNKLIIMLPLVILTPLCIYVLSKKVLKSTLGATTATIVYSFNTYFMLGRTGHLTLMLAFALAPLCLYLLIQALEKFSARHMVGMALVTFATSAFDARATYIVAWILVFYSCFWLYQNYKKREVMWRGIKLLFLGFGLIGLLNLYWVVGALATASLTSNSIFSRGLFGNDYMNLKQSLTLFHPFWTGMMPSDFVVQKIPHYFWLIPFAAFVGWFTNRKSKYIKFFAFVAVVGIFLSKQSGQPFPSIYLWLYNHFPGFNAFRESSKFFFVSALGYSILIGALITHLQKRKYLGFKFGWMAVMVSIWVIFCINILPFITGGVGSLFVPRQIPADYISYNNYIKSQPESFRILWLPQSSRWAIYDRNHPNINVTDLFSDNKLFDSNLDYSRQRLLANLNTPYFADQLQLTNIKYVVVPPRDVMNDDDFFTNFGLRRDVFIDQLNQLSYLTPIDIGSKELKIYQNNAFSPKVFALDHLYAFDNPDNPITKYYALEDRKRPFNFVINSTENSYFTQVLEDSFLAANPNPNLLDGFKSGFKDMEIQGCSAELAKYSDPNSRLAPTVGITNDGKAKLTHHLNAGCVKRQLSGLEPNKTYILSFTYRGQEGGGGGYMIGNSGGTTEFEKLSYAKKEARVSKVFKTNASVDGQFITLLSFAGGSAEYDNFVLKELDDSSTQLYSVRDAGDKLVKPQRVDLQTNGPTSKKIFIAGATKSFFLVLSEAYHPGWSLKLGSTVPAQHLALNNSLNVWYIDPEKVCSSPNSCKTNSDGSWDIHALAQFKPQTPLNIAFLVSMSALIGCLLYLSRVRVKSGN